jgi:hypothetical protein
VTSGTPGGNFGGGVGDIVETFSWNGIGPGVGAVRIIWGTGRAFPSNNTGDV